MEIYTRGFYVYKFLLTKEENLNCKYCSSLGYKSQEPKSGLQKYQINSIYTWHF